jgi:hypothetical protein
MDRRPLLRQIPLLHHLVSRMRRTLLTRLYRNRRKRQALRPNPMTLKLLIVIWTILIQEMRKTLTRLEGVKATLYFALTTR